MISFNGAAPAKIQNAEQNLKKIKSEIASVKSGDKMFNEALQNVFQGQELQCYVNPNNPNEAVIERELQGKLNLTSLCLILLFSIVPFLIFPWKYFFKKKELAT